MLQEFKDFAIKGNMVDLAVGVIIGGAFSKIVDSLVGDIFMPIVGFIAGGLDFSNYFLQLAGPKAGVLAKAKEAGATIAYGNFITIGINFAIIAFILFMLIKGINKMKKAEAAAAAAAPAPSGPSTEQLLGEIRDLLAKK